MAYYNQWDYAQQQQQFLESQMQIQMQMQIANQTLWDAQMQAQEIINSAKLNAQQIIENANTIAKKITDETNQAKENIALLKIAEKQSLEYVDEILAKAKKECDDEINKLVNPLGDEQKFIVLSKLMKLNILKNNSVSFNEYHRLVKKFSKN